MRKDYTEVLRHLTSIPRQHAFDPRPLFVRKPKKNPLSTMLPHRRLVIHIAARMGIPIESSALEVACSFSLSEV